MPSKGLAIRRGDFGLFTSSLSQQNLPESLDAVARHEAREHELDERLSKPFFGLFLSS